MTNEPRVLRRGRAFHLAVQRVWLVDSEGTDQQTERRIQVVPPGAERLRFGRTDVFLMAEDGYAVVVEIKATNWDRIRHVRRNLQSHRRQVWRYVDAFLDAYADRDVPIVDVTAGIIYPKRPRSEALTQTIQQYFDEHGIQVVWWEDDGR